MNTLLAPKPEERCSNIWSLNFMKSNFLPRELVLSTLIVASVLPLGCQPQSANSSGPGVIRLHDIFRAEDIKGRLTQEELKVPRTAWKFDGSESAPAVT